MNRLLRGSGTALPPNRLRQAHPSRLGLHCLQHSTTPTGRRRQHRRRRRRRRTSIPGGASKVGPGWGRRLERKPASTVEWRTKIVCTASKLNNLTYFLFVRELTDKKWRFFAEMFFGTLFVPFLYSYQLPFFEQLCRKCWSPQNCLT
jgi:hypothetical protein